MPRRLVCFCNALVLLFALLLAACGSAKATVPALPTATVAPAAAVTTPTARAAAPTPAPRAAPTATTMMAAPAMPMMRADVPAKAYDTLRYIQTHNGDAPPGYQGNTTFENRERRLPPGQYKEYDVDPRMPGGRNAERLVINQGTGQAYYTGDHYETFILIYPGR